MRSNKETMCFFKPLLRLLLLLASVSFQPYYPDTVAAIAQTEWVGEKSTPKKGKTAGFFGILFRCRFPEVPLHRF